MLGLSVVPNLSSSLFRFSCSSSRNVTFTLQKVLSPQLLQPFLVHSFISIHPESLWFQMSTFTIVHPSKNDIPPLIGIHDHPHLHPATSPLNPTRFLRSVIIQILINVANPAPCLGTNSNIPSSVSGVSMDYSSHLHQPALSSEWDRPFSIILNIGMCHCRWGEENVLAFSPYCSSTSQTVYL